MIGDVGGQIGFQTGGTRAVTQLVGAISLIPTSTSSTRAINYKSMTFPVSANNYSTLPTQRISLSATTTVYLIANVTYTVLGGASYNSDSYMLARRVR